jgi:hypothetical protein
MTLIFGGIDFPVFEMLFVLSALLLVGLTIVIIGTLYVLKELKALKALLKEEKFDIQEFEADLEEMENLEKGKDQTATLKSFIVDSLRKGYTWKQIKDGLVSKGWEQAKLEEIYRGLK